MTRKILPAVEIVSNWTSIAGAIEGILRFLGTDGGSSWVMGTTGYAFRLAIRSGAGGIATAEDTLTPETPTTRALHEGLGVRWEWQSAGPDDRDFDRRRKQAIARIRRSIDRGRPAAAYGLHLPEFGLIKGYDDGARRFFVSTTLSSQYGEALPWSQWPAPGQPRRIDVLLPGDRRRMDRSATERTALRFAVAEARRGAPAAESDAANGLAAYDRWLAGYGEPGRLDPYGNARCIQTLQAARRDAARYVRSVAASRQGDVAALLERAAAAYDAEALALSRLASLFPYPAGGDPTSPGALAAGAASLRQALAHERDAIESLEAALPAL